MCTSSIWGRNYTSSILLLVLLAFAGISDARSQSATIVGTISSAPIQNAHLVSAAHGWVLAGGNLFWTINNGQTWSNITPSLNGTRQIDSVYFLDETYAWAILHDAAGPGIYVATTNTAGSAWTIQQIASGGAEMNQFYGYTAHLTFTNPAQGWALLTKTSSAAASSGALFVTRDGGASWSRLPDPPGAGEIRFFAQMGWLVGGVNGMYGNHLWVTRDGGQSWHGQTVSPPPKIASASKIQFDYHLPVFNDAKHGILSVTYKILDPAAPYPQELSYVGIYSTLDGGNTWQLANSYRTSPMANSTSVDSTVIQSIAASGATVVTGTHASMHVAPLPPQLPRGYFDTNLLSFPDTNNGWILISRNRGCVKLGCQTVEALLATQDGGVTVTLVLAYTNTKD